MCSSDNSSAKPSASTDATRERTTDHPDLLEQRSLLDVAFGRLGEHEARHVDVAIREHGDARRHIREADRPPQASRQFFVEPRRRGEHGEVKVASTRHQHAIQGEERKPALLLGPLDVVVVGTEFDEPNA